MVIALKDIERAKSRMTELTPALRQHLALCMLLDTVTAWRGVTDHVVVVSGSPLVGAQMRRAGLDVALLPDPGIHVNSAFTAGAEFLGCRRVAASVADLPALTPRAAAAVLDAGGRGERWMAVDERGEGTTVLVADGVRLDPAFEHGSAERHAQAGVRRIAAPPGARCDVDHLDQLAAVARLGLGPHTARLMVHGELLRDERPITVSDALPTGWRVIDDAGRCLELPHEHAPAPRLAAGQRLHGLVHEGRVRDAWW